MVSLFLLLIADWPWSSDLRVDDAPHADLSETMFAPYYGSWIDNRTGPLRFGFSASEDEGQSWDPNQLHHYPLFPSDADPVVGVDAYGTLHEIFVNFDLGDYNAVVVHRSSTDGGKTWSDFSLVSQNNGVDIADKPWMAFSPSTDTIYSCYVLIHGWYEYSHGAYICRSTDRGRTWTDQKVSEYGTSCCRPFVCTDEAGNVYLMWLEYYTGAFFVSHSTDGGETWSTPTVATSVVMHVDHRANPIPWLVGGAPGTVYLTWPDEMYSSDYLYDVLFTKSTDYGETWSTPVAVNSATLRGHKACLPSLVKTPQGYLVLVWAQYKAEHVWSIEYAFSVDDGATWHITPGATGRVSETDFPLGQGNGMEMGDYITACADSEFVYALWPDDRDGNYKVYFSRARIEDIVGQATAEDLSGEAWSLSRTDRAVILNLERGVWVSAALYDVSGRRVCRLWRGTMGPGRHSLGVPEDMRAGTYFAVIEVDGAMRTLAFALAE